MKDIFETKIFCKECNNEMKKTFVEKSGFRLRAVECSKCGEKIVHPEDMNNFRDYKDLKKKTYSVKLRVVGNSHAISIPKEVVDFINNSHHRASRQMDDMVKLCFEDFGKLSLNFFDDEHEGENEGNIKARRNGGMRWH